MEENVVIAEMAWNGDDEVSTNGVPGGLGCPGPVGFACLGLGAVCTGAGLVCGLTCL